MGKKKKSTKRYVLSQLHRFDLLRREVHLSIESLDIKISTHRDTKSLDKAGRYLARGHSSRRSCSQNRPLKFAEVWPSFKRSTVHVSRAASPWPEFVSSFQILSLPQSDFISRSCVLCVYFYPAAFRPREKHRARMAKRTSCAFLIYLSMFEPSVISFIVREVRNRCVTRNYEFVIPCKYSYSEYSMRCTYPAESALTR